MDDLSPEERAKRSGAEPLMQLRSLQVSPVLSPCPSNAADREFARATRGSKCASYPRVRAPAESPLRGREPARRHNAPQRCPRSCVVTITQLRQRLA